MRSGYRFYFGKTKTDLVNVVFQKNAKNQKRRIQDCAACMSHSICPILIFFLNFEEHEQRLFMLAEEHMLFENHLNRQKSSSASPSGTLTILMVLTEETVRPEWELGCDHCGRVLEKPSHSATGKASA